MAGWRCTDCGVTWPWRDNFQTCACGATCDSIDGQPTHTMRDALSLYRRIEFAQHYEDHCRELGFEVDGPIPDGEVLAHAEAQ